MTPDESELEHYTAALRGDMPGPNDQARVRKLLAEAGVLASSVAAPGVALGAAAAGGGAAAKLGALPLALKVGGALVLAGIVATPLVRHATSNAREHANDPSSVQPRAGGVKNAPSRETAPVPTAVPAPAPLTTVAARVEPTRSRPSSAVARASEPTPRPATDALAVTPSAPAAPAVKAFDVAPPSRDEGTLRAETLLIERALTALRRGDSALSRRILAEHAARFPEGQLVRERERTLAKIAEKETNHASR